VRALPHLKETPVALFTPDQDAQKLQDLQDAGADFFLTKDLLCEPTVWQQKIKDLLEQIRAAAPH
jgi:CheY-like chemotaxis protein